MIKSQRLIGIGIAALVCTLLTACAGMQQTPTGFVAPGATWTEVSREGMVFGEGVVAAPNGMVYFSSMTRALPPGPDNPGGTIFRFDPATGQTTKYLEPSGMSNGLHFDRNGDLLIAQDSGGEGKGGGRAIMRRKLATGAMSVVADRYQGKHFNGPNDLTSDAKGTGLFHRRALRRHRSRWNCRTRCTGPIPTARSRSSPPTSSGRTASKSHPTANACTSAAANAKPLPTNPNGPAVDKFGITLGGIVVYDLDSGGNISNGRLFYRNDELMVDGMTMDRQGNLYVAMHNGNGKAPERGIVVLNPEGQIVERIPVPS